MPEIDERGVTENGSGATVAAISREIVRIYVEYYGRGPTKAKTHWHDEVVVCILADIFSRAERLLVDGGRFQQVRLTRQAFQEEIESVFRAAVEKETGHKVEACLSQVNEAGVAVEVFVLGPALDAPPA